MSRKIEQLFNKRKRLERESKEAGEQLDNAINELWGFSYSETNNDLIIDSLDYGISGISFKTFKEIMDSYKTKREKEES